MALRLPAPAFENKIVTFEELAARRAQLPGPVVMTNGVFDILHRGHVTYLAQARDLGKSLIVAVNSDASVKMLGKGDDRPINTEADRAAVLASLEAVDLVVIFKEKVPLKTFVWMKATMLLSKKLIKTAVPTLITAAPNGWPEPKKEILNAVFTLLLKLTAIRLS